MELNEYQQKAMTTCMDSCNNFSYMMLNMVGEMGEFASKVAKAIRKDNLSIGEYEPNVLDPRHRTSELEELTPDLKKEAGDILWQLAGLCHVMGWELNEIAWMNLEKLQSRQKRGVIDGNGDNR